jgi:hypothetical protein
MLAARFSPMLITAASTPATPAPRSTTGSVASPCTARLTNSAWRSIRMPSASIAITWWPSDSSVRATHEPNLPSPITA